MSWTILFTSNLKQLWCNLWVNVQCNSVYIPNFINLTLYMFSTMENNNKKTFLSQIVLLQRFCHKFCPGVIVGFSEVQTGNATVWCRVEGPHEQLGVRPPDPDASPWWHRRLWGVGEQKRGMTERREKRERNQSRVAPVPSESLPCTPRPQQRLCGAPVFYFSCRGHSRRCHAGINTYWQLPAWERGGATVRYEQRGSPESGWWEDSWSTSKTSAA